MLNSKDHKSDEDNPLVGDDEIEIPGIVPLQQQVSGKKISVQVTPMFHRDEDIQHESSSNVSEGEASQKSIEAFPINTDDSISPVDKSRMTQDNSKMVMGHYRHLSDPMQKSARIGKIYRVSSQKKGFAPSPSYLSPQGEADKSLVNDDTQNATWSDVGQACCCHSPREWFSILVGVSSLLCCLYFFLLSLSLLGTSFKVVGGCTAGSMLGSDTNPVASLCIGIIATALLQSSSTTTSIVVSLVTSENGNGLQVQQAIYIVMGANIGTSVTSMIVSLAHMSNEDEMERAFSGASLLLVFNTLTAVILFPLELMTRYLYEFTKIMLPTNVGKSDKWEGPVKKIVSPLADKIIMANKNLIEDIANGGTCEENYPVSCVDGIVDYNNCVEEGSVGLISCSESTGKCPIFFQVGGTKDDDIVSGWVCLIMSLFLLIVCLIVLVSLLKKILLGASTRIIYKVIKF